jgi:hypothetical protein
MGLLDDAIREHLELKRRRGADASEIARLQSEALGPVRRVGPAESGSGANETHARAIASEREDAKPEAEYEEYYTEEFYAEENGDDWGDAFADEDFEARRGSRRRAEEPSDAVSEPIDEPPSEEEAETGSFRWRRGRRASNRDTETPPSPPADDEADDDLADGKETVEYDVGDALNEGQRDRKGETGRRSSREDEGDVLEETPEFLQDAPEHDRLWFEQRPPRDFDFDD